MGVTIQVDDAAALRSLAQLQQAAPHLVDAPKRATHERKGGAS